MNELYAHVTLSPEAVGARFKRFREMAGLSIGQAAMLMQEIREETGEPIPSLAEMINLD